jgi:hypothetical protein
MPAPFTRPIQSLRCPEKRIEVSRQQKIELGTLSSYVFRQGECPACFKQDLIASRDAFLAHLNSRSFGKQSDSRDENGLDAGKTRALRRSVIAARQQSLLTAHERRSTWHWPPLALTEPYRGTIITTSTTYRLGRTSFSYALPSDASSPFKEKT